MDTLFGFVGKDYTLIAADAGAARSIYVMKEDDDRVMVLDKFKLLGGAGEQGDRVAFCEYVQKNIQLYEVRYGFSLNTHATANFIRTNLAASLRRSPYYVNLLLGGYDKSEGPSLYFFDYLGSMHKMEFGTHGYASYFITSVFDKYYRKDLSKKEGLELMRRCIDELKKRFAIRVGNFVVKIVDENGARVFGADEEIEL